MAPGDQRPHVLAGLGACSGNLAALRFADLIQRTPQGRIRGHRAEKFGLIPQHGQIREHPATVGDQHRRVRQHPAPIMHRQETTAGQRPRQPGGQAGPVGQQPHRRRTSMIDHVVAGDFHSQVLRPPATMHLESAP